MNSPDGEWITVKRTRKPKNANVNNAASTRPAPVPTKRYDGQDHTPVIIRRSGKSSNRRGPKNTVARRSGLAGHAASIERKADEGSYQTKKFDTKFVRRIQEVRRVNELSQDDLNHKLCLPKNTINQLESNKLLYNPKLKSQIESRLIRLKM